jgi:hypothetical protein
MISVFTPVPPSDPVVQRKILCVKIFGVGCVVGLWVLAMAAFLGYVPIRLFWIATGAEIVLGLWTIRKVYSLRNLSRSIGVYNTRKT